MSGIPYKLDGLDGDNEVRAKFTSFYASMALSKGDAVCIDVATTTNGIGNHITQADVDAAATKQALQSWMLLVQRPLEICLVRQQLLANLRFSLLTMLRQSPSTLLKMWQELTGLLTALSIC